jgi:NitT/TauT family transport system substrate-binding protein
MLAPIPINTDKRAFLCRAAALTAAGLLRSGPSAAAEPALEITRIRLAHSPSICTAPQYLAEQLLRLEGFREIQYVPAGARNGPYALADGRADLTMWDAPGLMPHLDADRPIVVLCGVHDGCYELFGNGRVRAIRDLKGKTIALQAFCYGDHVLLASMLSYVGMDPQKDVEWNVGENMVDAMELFAAGKADAFLAFSQQAEELRQKKVGHVIVNTAEDRPWSHYFCCMLAASRDFTQRYPVATKRALRAVLKAADICATEPARVARFLADNLYEPRYHIGLPVMRRLRYSRWREADPEDTLRFLALRLHEVGMIKSTPQQLIAQGTEWRFLNELK